MTATQTTIEPREAYHAVRRAVTSYNPLHREYTAKRPGQHWPQTTWDRKVRDTLRSLTGRKVLRPDQSRLAERIQAALIERNETFIPRSRSKTLAERLRARLCAKYLAEADRRGLPTELDLGKDGWDELRIVSEGADNGHRVAVLHASGWKKYSNAFGSRHQTLSLLCGRDDAGLWAVRIPGTITTVDAGLAWLKPAIVRNAEAAGKRVMRQGDVWLVERRRDDMSALPSGHRWDAETRTLYHDGHAHVHVPFPAIAVPQSTLAVNGTQRRRGD